MASPDSRAASLPATPGLPASVRDRGAGRIGGIEKLEEFDELAAAVALPDERVSTTSIAIPSSTLGPTSLPRPPDMIRTMETLT